MPLNHSTPGAHATRIVIIGGGFSGIGMAIRLRQQGIDDFVILERAADSGGTWRDNSYPGCACDVESALYSFSFAPNPEWSSVFAPQPEIWAYLRQCATDFDIDRHFVFGQNVTGASWDDGAQLWTVTTPTHTWQAQSIVMANGPLSDPALPDIAGLDTFAGRVFHSSQWDHGYAFRDKRVAVIGTGASAIQFIPRIQPDVAQLNVFQRTPPWVLPRNDTAIPEWRKSQYRRLPITQRLQRAAVYLKRELMHVPFRSRAVARIAEWQARRFMASQVTDPTLRAVLTPTYQIGCKRILISDDYYPALVKPNVSVIATAIDSVTPQGIVTTDGVLHAADAIILSTGFRPTDPPLAPYIVGRNESSLAEAWRGSPTAYMGTTIAGFPNLFMLLGPNTGLGHSSVVLMVEAQIDHILGVLQLLEQRGSNAAEPMLAAQQRFARMVDERLAATAWNSGGCKSWYLDRTGRNSALWPDGVGRFRRTVQHVIPADYRLAPPRGPATLETHV